MIKRILEPFGFENPREAQWRIKLMAEGPEGSRFSPGVRTKLIEIAPTLLSCLRHTPDPDLAEATLKAIYPHISGQFKQQYGIPLTSDGVEATFSIIGMGKLGGRELNFSSDLDVMMVYSGQGESTKGLSNAEYFAKLGLELINRFKDTGSGTIYELDLRLRPYGTGGALALPLDGYKSYYEEHAETWERQALIRARPVAGDECLGRRFLEVAHTFAYRQPLTQDEVAEIIHT